MNLPSTASRNQQRSRQPKKDEKGNGKQAQQQETDDQISHTASSYEQVVIFILPCFIKT
jgi:hypothetical protein